MSWIFPPNGNSHLFVDAMIDAQKNYIGKKKLHITADYFPSKLYINTTIV